MPGMTMPQQTWYGDAAAYLGLWMTMMVPMMLPSLVPMLRRYRASMGAAAGFRPHGLTTLVAVGYFAVWAALGAISYGASAGARAAALHWPTIAHWFPIVLGAVLLVAGAVQFTAWKARQLARWHEDSGCGCLAVPD